MKTSLAELATAGKVTEFCVNLNWPYCPKEHDDPAIVREVMKKLASTIDRAVLAAAGEIEAHRQNGASPPRNLSKPRDQ